MRTITFDNLLQPEDKKQQIDFCISSIRVGLDRITGFDKSKLAPWAQAYPILSGIFKKQCGDFFPVCLQQSPQYLISLAKFLIDDGLDSKEMTEFCKLWPQPQYRFDRKRVIFLSNLRYKGDKKLYYSDDNQISKSDSKANLISWKVIPHNADGNALKMPLTILELIGIEHQSRLEFISNYLAIQRYLRDDGQWVGQPLHELLTLPHYVEPAFCAIDLLVKSHQKRLQAQYVLEEAFALFK